ncbi:hypothetical protein C8Q79DRAFT_903196, partial [Trametes meyenii]
RVVKIMNFTEPNANRYNIGLIPLTSAWGPIGDGSGLESFLCVNGRPVTAWIVGIVTSPWLKALQDSRVSLGFRALCQHDLDAAKYFQLKACNPEADPSHAHLSTTAKRFPARRGEACDGAFEDIFDATDRLGPWSTMRKIDYTNVRKSDVVLVESHIRRFKIKDASGQYNWGSWAVNFELLRIAVLFSGPGPANVVPEDSQVNL